MNPEKPHTQVIYPESAFSTAEEVRKQQEAWTCASNRQVDYTYVNRHHVFNISDELLQRTLWDTHELPE